MVRRCGLSTSYFIWCLLPFFFNSPTQAIVNRPSGVAQLITLFFNQATGPMKQPRELSVFLNTPAPLHPGVFLELPNIGFGVRHVQKMQNAFLLLSPLTSMISQCLSGHVPWTWLFPIPELMVSRVPHRPSERGVEGERSLPCPLTRL